MSLLALSLAAYAATASPACNIAPTDPQYAAYKANVSHHVPEWFTVDLDKPPQERWKALVGPAAADIKAMIDAFKAEGGILTKALFALLEKTFGGYASKLLEALPAPYSGEIEGIVNATGIGALDIFMYNIMYELSGACTSIVAQDAQGRLYHGRNLDFGPAKLAAKLRPLLRNLRFVRGGQVVFNSTTFLGYVGCLTCAKAGAFSVTVDTRMWTKLPDALVAWILGIDRSGHFLTFATRDAFELGGYADAVAQLNSTKLLGPAYMIVGGVRAGEGAVLTRDAKESLHYWALPDSSKPYLLETNYVRPRPRPARRHAFPAPTRPSAAAQDHWDGKPHDRRDDGNACMDEQVAAGAIGFEALFKTLSAAPTHNEDTTYTTLMSNFDGGFEAYIQTPM